MSSNPLDARPLIVVVAGPNGSGKSTFYETFLSRTGLHWVNADHVARSLGADPYEASHIAEQFCAELVTQQESFVWETVLSDPVGAKVSFLTNAQARGYTVLLCFIDLDSAAVSDERVAMRVLQGGHDVPPEKIMARYPRSLANLKRALAALKLVWVYDNSDLEQPFRKVAEFEDGELTARFPPLPAWLGR
jgi:predicted ABC-type ATPase